MSTRKQKGKSIRKSVRWACDFDYLNDLPDAEYEWITQFIDEYYRCALNRDGSDFHDTDELRHSVYNMINTSNIELTTRNIDVLQKESLVKSERRKYSKHDYPWGADEAFNPEDALIEWIDTGLSIVDIL